MADLDTRRHDFRIAIENWHHDLNIGTVVRTANAFLAEEMRIVGRRRWNRRGAMVTDRYQHVRHVATVAELVETKGDAVIVAVDNLPGAVPIETAALPGKALLLFGQEGSGLDRRGARRGRPGLLDRPVRLDPVDQRRRRGRDRDARLDSSARGAAGLSQPSWLRR